jgi:hypothetical protein
MSAIDPEPSLFGMKTNKRWIEVKNNANRKPEIPPVTSADQYHSKSLQTMLCKFATAHICAF